MFFATKRVRQGVNVIGLKNKLSRERIAPEIGRRADRGDSIVAIVRLSRQAVQPKGI